jgi:group II intron reverse transcriptase/maturase
MRTAETVLGIIRERGKQGLPLHDLYRQLYNPDLYLSAYARLYSNAGAMTPGTTRESVDGMSLTRIRQIIDDLHSERYRWTPVKRVYIPKRNGKQRPLGIPTWSDKLLQEVIRALLEAYYEPQFSDASHGFRPERGCHTALEEVATNWTGTTWFIEGDIAQCFDCIDHEVLLKILGERIHDQRFLRLLSNLLQAGYLEEWKYNTTLSGTPQGAVLSPILANIYLDRFDQFVEGHLKPAYTRGAKRRPSKAYEALRQRTVKARKRGDKKKATHLQTQLQHMPSMETHDPAYRRLRYIRYADDWLIGFIGPKEEAEEIKRAIGEFLRDTLKLELSQEKTLITHARSEAARFLGYEIVTQHADGKHDHHGHRKVNGTIGLRVPAEVITNACRRYMEGGKTTARYELIHDEDFSIVSRYQAEYRGLVQYYLLAQNVSWFWTLNWRMKSSLLKTLACKHGRSQTAIAHQYAANVETPYGTMKCLQVVVEREGKKPLVAQFGGIPLRRQKGRFLIDRNPLSTIRYGRNELVKRLLATRCELCGAREHIEVHHLRKLADLKKQGQKDRPEWVKQMAARRRKTLVVCRKCHQAIHAGKLQHPTRNTSLESRVR